MPPKATACNTEHETSEQDRISALEAERLQVAAFESLVLSRTRRLSASEAEPHRALIKADGKDIVKRSAVRKNRYLLNVNAELAALAAGNMGTLAALDTKNPLLYIDFPEGRLKFFGTLVFPRNRYLVLRLGQKDIICEDVLENMVVFAEAWWVGKMDSNPKEERLPIPESVLQTGAKAADAAAAAKGSTEASTMRPPAADMQAQPQSASKSRKRARAASGNMSESSSGEEDAEEEEPASAVRTSQRNRGARPQYVVDLDEDANVSDEDGSAREGAAPARSGGAAQPCGREARSASDDGEPEAAPVEAARGKKRATARTSMGAADAGAEAAEGLGRLAACPGSAAAPSRKPVRKKAPQPQAAPKGWARGSAAAGEDPGLPISLLSSGDEEPSAVEARRPARAAAGAARAKLRRKPSENEANGEDGEDGNSVSSQSQDGDSEFSL